MSHSQNKADIIYGYYLRYHKKAFQVAYSVLNDKYLAQDIAQDVFIELIEKFDQLNLTDEIKVQTLICRIAKNKSIDYIRRSVKEEALMEQIAKNIENKPSKEIELVDAILEEMPKREADLIRCKYLIGYSGKEIAEEFGIRESSVTKTMQRARRSFEEYYRKELGIKEK